MKNPENQDTLPNLETILNAINGLRQETTDTINGLRQQMNERFDKVEMRLANVESRLTNVENDVRQIKDMQFVFENEFDRLLALAYKSLELSHENRADVRIMRKEIAVWSAEVMNLER
ncbi:MAG: hypothetical protein H0V31_08570 [Acidobacteria bacterium]|nr:hypothetical protein [Acidobacteriota bacterium]